MRLAAANGFRNLGAAALALAVLSGCATHTQPKPDDAKVKQFAGKGYLTDDQYGIATSFASWKVGEYGFDLALTVPAKPGPFPLVIYLPALGETRSAGEAWRTAWARGGYAVLSLQPLADDAKAWHSAQARTGDFAALARERYSAKAMAARLTALGTALNELARRQALKEAPLERIDLSKVAVAGFDLGAYAAMAVAGENIRGGAPTLPLPIAAVIALSPYADFSGATFDARYGGIHGPVLAVTSDNDADAVGLVTSPSVRKAPFQYMPGGDKYLVTMWDIPHAILSGNEAKQGAEEEGRAPRPAGEGGNGPQGSGRRGGRKGGAGGRGGEDSPSSAGGGRASPTSQAIGVAAIQGITAAFLDAYLKNDPIAREWLAQDASRWLGDKGEIKKK